MKKCLFLLLAALIALSLTGSCALADSVSVTGTVIPAETVQVYAPAGGTVASVSARTGQTVTAGDPLFTLKTTPVYAEEDGTVTGIFGRPGDSADTVTSRYGAVLYLEGTCAYTVSASISNGYNSAEARFVHIGEPVFLQCRSSTARAGTGIITSAEGNSFQVKVLSGVFIPGDSVDIYRDSAYTTTSRIGRGTVSRVSPTAVTASGAIVRIAVEDGASVRRGDLLLETVEGSFDGLIMTGTEVTAPVSGAVGSISVSAGGAIQKGSLAAVLYPAERMQAEAFVSEEICSLIHEGDPMLVELAANENVSYPGTVSLVSAVAEEGTEEVSYRVVVDFVPDENVRFGMTVILSTPEESPSR